MKFLLLFFVFLKTESLYFFIGEGEKKCFLEDVPENTQILLNYKIEILDPQTKEYRTSELGMEVEVRDPAHQIVLSKTYSNEGKISSTLHSAGQHSICLHSNRSHFFSHNKKLKVHLNIDIGEDSIDYDEVSKKERLTELQVRFRKLSDQLEKISREQNYYRFREEIFRNKSVKTNSRVLWWALSQVFVLCLTGLWQLRNLKKFFQSKKLV